LLAGEAEFGRAHAGADLLLEGVDHFGVLQNLSALLITETIAHVRVVDDLHETAALMDLANYILDDTLFDGVDRHLIDELLDAIVDAGHSSSSSYAGGDR
jgi:hypothetical protein